MPKRLTIELFETSEGKIDDENWRSRHQPLLIAASAAADWRSRHQPLLIVDDKKWCPNDDANNAETRTGRAQHDPTRAAACSRFML